jgi:acetyl-CoA carboxylase carboxyltransferase component
MRERSLFMNAARTYTFDEVIDPAETRDRMIRMIRLLPRPAARDRKKHYVDTW